MRIRSLAVVLGAFVPLLTVGAGPAPASDCPADCPSNDRPAIRIGAVAYSPDAVTVFEGIRRHFGRNGMKVDYVLYSNYDALVEALHKGHVGVAWNTPLAHAQYHLRAG